MPRTDDEMPKRKVGALCFDKFELLDVFGPLERFGVLPDAFELGTIGERGPSIASTQGPRVVIEHSFADAGQLDVLLVPGGISTRVEIENDALLDSVVRVLLRRGRIRRLRQQRQAEAGVGR